MEMILGVLVFSLFSIYASFTILRKYEALEKTELVSYVVMIAWGSLAFGIYISRYAVN